MFRYLYETAKHRAWVVLYLAAFALRLVWRAIVHDLSKFRPDEARPMAATLPRLRGTTYGSEEYRAALRDIQPAVQLHYQRNRHHLEHWPNGIADMSLADVVEMWCDWRAVTRRHADGDLRRSVETNRERFGLGTLGDVLANEADRLEKA